MQTDPPTYRWMSVDSRLLELCLVVGVEKMSGSPPAESMPSERQLNSTQHEPTVCWLLLGGLEAWLAAKFP
jgi:hypothetical protein